MIPGPHKPGPLRRRARARAHYFAVVAYPDWSGRPRVIGALTLFSLLGLSRLRGARRADPVVDAYWKLLERRSAWMPV
jgi:hypothetical protein